LEIRKITIVVEIYVMSRKYINLNDECLVRYFKDIKNIELLTPEEEVELAKRIKDGDDKAIEKLVSSNLKFVISIAKEYQFQGTPLNDLINDGNEGLIKAALKFDHTKGFRFISYAVWWIRQSIIHGLNCNARTIRLPANVINSLNHIKKQTEKFEFENEREPIIGEILDEENNIEFMETISKTSSLNTIINEDGGELVELVTDDSLEAPDKDDEGDKLIKDELNSMLSKLSDREKDIVILYFGLDKSREPMTLEAIGEKYDLTKERIRQIKEKAIRKLRHDMDNLYELVKNEED
jgi:RNA polymerase primary sigma factor